MSAPHARDDNSEPRTFEEELAVLEKAVQDLENGHLTLEEAIACFENGFAAMRRCYALLRDTQKRVESLVAEEDADGDGAVSWMDAQGGGETGGGETGAGGTAFTALRSLEIRLARGAGARPRSAADGEAFEEKGAGGIRENGEPEDGGPASEEGGPPAAPAGTKRQRHRQQQAPSGSASEGESRYAGDFAGNE